MAADAADDAILSLMALLQQRWRCARLSLCRKLRDAEGVQRRWSVMTVLEEGGGAPARYSTYQLPVWHKVADELGGGSAWAAGMLHALHFDRAASVVERWPSKWKGDAGKNGARTGRHTSTSSTPTGAFGPRRCGGGSRSAWFAQRRGRLQGALTYTLWPLLEGRSSPFGAPTSSPPSANSLPETFRPSQPPSCETLSSPLLASRRAFPRRPSAMEARCSPGAGSRRLLQRERRRPSVPVPPLAPAPS